MAPQLEKKDSAIPFEVMIAKKFNNPSLCIEGEEECTNLDHLCYDEDVARLSREFQAPSLLEVRQMNRRQTSRLKSLG